MNEDANIDPMKAFVEPPEEKQADPLSFGKAAAAIAMPDLPADSQHLKESLCLKAYLAAKLSFSDWFEHFHKGKPRAPEKPAKGSPSLRLKSKIFRLRQPKQPKKFGAQLMRLQMK